MLKSFVEHKIIAIFVALKSAGGSPRRSINTLKGLYVACTFVVQAITFLNTRGPTTTKQSGPTTATDWPLSRQQADQTQQQLAPPPSPPP